MIVSNLSVRLGLVNGTKGVLYDLICNEHGDVVAVLLRVKRSSELYMYMYTERVRAVCGNTPKTTRGQADMFRILLVAASSTNAYSGPCFFKDSVNLPGGEAGAFDRSSECIVSIPLSTERLYILNEMQTRKQFPLQLAAAITIHKVRSSYSALNLRLPKCMHRLSKHLCVQTCAGARLDTGCSSRRYWEGRGKS